MMAHELIRDFTKAHGKRACIKVDLQNPFIASTENSSIICYTA